ncbi:hypothetical protein E3Q14_03996 [Wallemia mellicola]|nr:hypothetical protein E3Q14_03996 [Wallemia mellicola]
MSHSLETKANNHNILEEAVNVAKRASFDSNSLSHLESLAQSERAQLVHKHRELHDDDAEQDVTSVSGALSDDGSNRKIGSLVWPKSSWIINWP